MLDVSMPISVAILNEDLRYIFINSDTYRMFGITSDDVVVGDSLGDMHACLVEKGLLPRDEVRSGDISASRVATDLATQNSSSQIVQMLDGRSSRLTRVRLPNGYTVSIAEDVTELVAATALVDDAIHLGKSGYWIYDFATKTYTVSDTLLTVLRPEQVEYVKKHGPLSAVHPDDKATYAAAIKSLGEGKETFEVTTRAGFIPVPLYFLSVGKLVKLADGRPHQVRCFVREVTKTELQKRELSKAKDEAIAANVAKSQFLANMSHEIRTPMNGVLGMAELLAGSALDDRQREFVNVITRSATTLLTVINDILDFSKIEADALELENEPFSLRETVSEVTSLLSQKAAEKGLELIVDYPSSMPRSFLGDAVRVRQILTNLVGNALKFTDDGHVLISVKANGAQDGFSMSVTDTGIGIEEDKVREIFEKFTQADNSTTRIYGGTGLGLSISRRLAEMMGGSLSLSSIYGEGSTFTATLPLPRDRTAKPVVRNTAPLRGKRALIVDDIDINRRLLSEQLTGWGMQVKSVGDGVEALMALKSASQENGGKPPFDVIVMDYLMPGVNGRELANMIHAQPHLDAPMLMLSSCDERQGHDRRSMEGVDRYLVKPVREQTLFDAVVALVYADGDTAKLGPKNPTAPVQVSPPVKTIETGVRRAAASKIEILVAEDFPLNQDVVRLMLADTAYEPVIVENGQLALRLYESEADRFAAILMDVSMPVMDGYTATTRIREVESDRGLERKPIIALTGHALTHEREKCLDAGMDDYLTKPVKQGELIGRLDHWTGTTTRVAVA